LAKPPPGKGFSGIANKRIIPDDCRCRGRRVGAARFGGCPTARGEHRMSYTVSHFEIRAHDQKAMEKFYN